MQIINGDILNIVEGEAKRLDAWTANRAERHGIVNRGKISNTIVEQQQDKIIITVMATPSIRFRDGGFGRYYNKGIRVATVRIGNVIRKRKRANILNRPMFGMIHRLSEMGLINMAKAVTTTIKELLKK